tara:strand:+ start:1054 stop:1905 length:852 start_codon:yes stop_codon:yes gene_type:complete
MSIIKVKTGGITADAITDALIADDVVGTEHLTANEVDTTALGADAVTGAQLADDAVNSEHYTDGSIDTAHLADGQVTTAKLATAVFTGATDIGADIADADLFLLDDGAGGTIRKTAASRIKTYVGGGITNAQQWRITANITGMDNGDHITANWEEADTYGYGRIGNTMASASGIFTFPTTGFWLITHNVTFLDATEQNHLSCIITATTDNSSYNSVSISKTSLKLINSANTFAAASAQHIFDVTNTTTHKIRFAIGCENNNIEVVGNTGANYTSATFIRLGDT